MTFKEYFIKSLLESPTNTGEFVSEFSDTEIAKNIYEEIIQNPLQYKMVASLLNDTIMLYEFRDINDIILYFVPKNDNFIYGYLTYKIKTDGD